MTIDLPVRPRLPFLMGAALLSLFGCAAAETSPAEGEGLASTDETLVVLSPCRPGVCGDVKDKKGRVWSCDCASSCNVERDLVKRASPSGLYLPSPSGAVLVAMSPATSSERSRLGLVSAFFTAMGPHGTGQWRGFWHVTVPGGEHVKIASNPGLSSVSAARTDLDGNGIRDIVLGGIGSNPGTPAWFYSVLEPNGLQSRPTPVLSIPVQFDRSRQGNIAVGQLDSDPRPDFVVAGDVSSVSGGAWEYHLGMNCDADGRCLWLPAQSVDAGGYTFGSSLAVGDLDGDRIDEIVVTAHDSYDLRYRIGSACNTVSGSCTWTPVQSIAGGGPRIRATSVAVAEVRPTRPRRKQIVLGTLRDNADWVVVSHNFCSKTTGYCDWGTPRSFPMTDGREGGAMTLDDIDGDAVPELLFTSYGGGEATALVECPNADALGDLLVHPR
jgi:hypothetical protein